MADAEMTAIFGRRGTGKTTRARELIGKARRVLIFDPQDEYQAGGFDRVAWGQVTPTLRSSGPIRARYVPPREGRIEALSAISKWLLDNRTRQAPRLTLVVDEIHTAFPEQALAPGLGGFGHLCEQGRHANVEVIGITQRPATVSKRFVGNCRDFYIFALQYPTDLDALQRFVGRENRQAIAGLADYEYLHYRDMKVTRGKTKKR